MHLNLVIISRANQKVKTNREILERVIQNYFEWRWFLGPNINKKKTTIMIKINKPYMPIPGFWPLNGEKIPKKDTIAGAKAVPTLQPTNRMELANPSASFGMRLSMVLKI